MTFALMAWDKDGALPVRMENRPDHLAYLESTGVVQKAGPFLDAEGQPCGSLIVLDVPDLAAAQAWACLLYTSPSPRDQRGSRMPSSA